MPAYLVAQEGPHKGSKLDLSEGTEWIIGRDPDEADFVIDDPTVSRKHAKLMRTSDGIAIKNLSRTNTMLINDEEISGSYLLKDKDRFQIGNTVFQFEETAKGGYDDIFGDIEEPSPMAEEKKEEDLSAKLPPKPEMTAYDTIFEDTGEEIDLPFHITPEMPLMLKVISGPNAGAEIGLEKGRTYIIGKDSQSADIVFQDMSVSRNHARLTISGEGILTIEDLGSKNGTAVNGAPVTELQAFIPQDLVAVGTTIFMAIDTEAPQETIFSPTAPSHETKEEEFPFAAPEAPLVEELKDWKKEPIPTKHLVMAGSIAAIFLIAFLSFFSLFKSNQVEIVQKEPVKEIKEALDKFPDVQFSYNPGSGRLFLAGHVLTPIEYQEMRYLLAQIPFILSTEDNVVIDEGVWKMMNDVISNNPSWRGVSIHSPKPGRFVATGYLDTAADAASLNEYLTVNFPYLDRLDNQVIVQEALNAQISSMIAAESIGAIDFQLINGQLVLTGRYNEQKTRQFEALVKHLNQVKGVTLVKNFAIGVSPTQASIDLTKDFQVSGISMYDGRGYSVILDGKIFTVGDQVVDGLKIFAIEPDTILLEKDGLKYKIDYRR